MKRFTKKYLPWSILNNLLWCLFIYGMIILDLRTSEDFNMDDFEAAQGFVKILVVIIFIVMGIYKLLYYKTAKYQLGEKQIVCETGIIFKKKSFLEYHRMHAIHKKQGLLQQMFGICSLSIGSGSTKSAHVAEIRIIEDSKIVNEIMLLIKNRQSNEIIEVEDEIDFEERVYQFDTGKKFISTIFNLLSLIFGLGIIFILIVASNFVVKVISNFNFITRTFFSVSLMILIGSIIISVIANILMMFVGYYDFGITKTKDALLISHGLFEKQNNLIRYNRIKSVKVTQSLIKRIFGYAEITIDVIGYGQQSTDEDNKNNYNKGLLVPLCKMSDVNDILSDLLPNYVPIIREHKSISFLAYTNIPFIIISLVYLFIMFVFMVIALALNNTVLLSIGMLILGILWLFAVIMLLIVKTLEYYNNGVGIKDNKLTIYHGGFVKEAIVITKDNIIGLDKVTTKWRRKHNIYSYVIHYKNNHVINTIKVNNLSGDLFEELKGLLTF